MTKSEKKLNEVSPLKKITVKGRTVFIDVSGFKKKLDKLAREFNKRLNKK